MSERSTSELRPAPIMSETITQAIRSGAGVFMQPVQRCYEVFPHVLRECVHVRQTLHGLALPRRFSVIKKPRNKRRTAHTGRQCLADRLKSIIPLMWRKEGRKCFYLTTHSTHFIYGYMASDIWLRTILIVRKETRCLHIGYSFWLTARVLLYAPFHRQDSSYHSICYTSRGSLAGTRNISWVHHEGSIRWPIARWANTYNGATSRSLL